MNFTISGEDFDFTLEVDGSGNLTAFTATKDATTYDCTIQLTSRTPEADRICCGPSGCMSGSC